jgi:hypothetical protein
LAFLALCTAGPKATFAMLPAPIKPQLVLICLI